MKCIYVSGEIKDDERFMEIMEELEDEVNLDIDEEDDYNIAVSKSSYDV